MNEIAKHSDNSVPFVGGTKSFPSLPLEGHIVPWNMFSPFCLWDKSFCMPCNFFTSHAKFLPPMQNFCIISQFKPYSVGITLRQSTSSPSSLVTFKQSVSSSNSQGFGEPDWVCLINLHTCSSPPDNIRQHFLLLFSTAIFSVVFLHMYPGSTTPDAPTAQPRAVKRHKLVDHLWGHVTESQQQPYDDQTPGQQLHSNSTQPPPQTPTLGIDWSSTAKRIATKILPELLDITNYTTLFIFVRT